MPIQVLPENLVNQIAAGEVIVRPASAVKELVENALDAGAGRIIIHIANGGRDLRVTDDGCGMGPEDAALALVRHATSKIREFDDLYRLTTRGFRGEALASIAAVARVRLLTRRAEDLAGTLVTSDGGSPPMIQQAGAPPGTDIHIRDLFYNTPARLKFLKAPGSETTAILSTVTRLAIARPEIGFRVTGESGTYIELPRKQDWAQRSAALMGFPDQAAHMLPVEFERHGVHIRGFTGHPNLSGRDRRRQHFLLEGRPISSRTLGMVLQEAYRGVIMVGRFPWCVLDIRVPEGDVDINVHPTKEEVRFRREPLVTSVIYRGVQGALRAAHIVPEADLEGTEMPLSSPGPIAPTVASAPRPTMNPGQQDPLSVQQPNPTEQGSSAALGTAYQPEMLQWPEVVRTPGGSRTTPVPLDMSGMVTARGPDFGISLDPRPSSNDAPIEPGWAVLEAARPGDSNTASTEPPPGSPGAEPQPSPLDAGDATEDAVFRWLRESGAPPEVLGQVADCYIVARAGETLLLIDQHAAHERIMYARLTATTAPVPSQPLLIPLTVDVPPEAVPALHAALPLLAWFGFEAAHFGGQTFVVQSTPGDLLPRLDPLALLQDLLADLASPETRTRPNELEQLRDRIITRMSCRSAIKAGQTLHSEEMKALMQDLATTPLGTNCPHGRPTMVTLTRATLDKLFKRVV